jgi:hypothetical protein
MHVKRYAIKIVVDKKCDVTYIKKIVFKNP